MDARERDKERQRERSVNKRLALRGYAHAEADGIDRPRGGGRGGRGTQHAARYSSIPFESATRLAADVFD